MIPSDYIALAAFLVSILAAIYAHRSASEAKKANEISLHFNKVEIYEEVLSFTECFTGLFNVPTPERLQAFKENALVKSEIYLSEECHHQLLEIYRHCDESEVWLRISKDKASGEMEIRANYKSVLNLLYPAIDLIKSEIKLNNV